MKSLYIVAFLRQEPKMIVTNDSFPAPTLMEQQQQTVRFVADRQMVDFVEIGYLSLSVCLGTLLNAIALARLIRYSRSPSASAKHLFARPLHMNAFTLLKFNLAVTDFAILLIHALGKVVWLLSYRWLFGDFGCRLYQFLSAFAYYSNSNVVVAIGLDRLKVVYLSRVQSVSSSICRVRLFLAVAWALAVICALPQLFFWTNFEVGPSWSQCTTIWQIAKYSRPDESTSPSPSSFVSPTSSPHWSVSERTQFYYELLHQAVVFVIPFISLSASYLLIVVRVIRYTLRPNSNNCNYSSYSSFNGLDYAEEELAKPSRYQSMSWRLRKISSRECRCFLQKLNLLQQSTKSGGQCRTACAAPPPSPNALTSGGAARTEVRKFPSLGESSYFLLPQQHNQQEGADVLLVARALKPGSSRKLSAEVFASAKGTDQCGSRLEAGAKRCSLNAVLEQAELGRLHPSAGQHHFLLSSAPSRAFALASQMSARHRLSLGKPSIASTGGVSPVWRRQLRSKVFIRSLLIVAAHCAFWLPYNLLNLLRFADEHFYTRLVDSGALLVEDLIVMNSLINPVLYGYGK